MPGPNRFFSVGAGGVVCGECRPAGSVVPSQEALGLLGALLGGDWETADACEPRHCREGSGLVAAYLQWHLERGLRSLRFVEK
jgi:DNA repair protein RecO (recombination protein O)